MNFPPFNLGRTLSEKLRHYLNGVSGGSHFIPNGPLVRELDFGEFVQSVHDLGATEAAKGAALVAVDTALGFSGTTVRAALGELLGRVVALEAGGGSGAETFRTISSFPATVASDDVLLLVTAAGTLPLPATATTGRKLAIRARGGAVTLTHANIETDAGTVSTSLSLPDNSGVILRGDGTRWLIFPG